MTKQDFLNLSLGELEKRTGMDDTAWSRWFKGRVSPKLYKLEEVAIALEMPIGEFVEALIQRRSQSSRVKKQASLLSK